MQCQLDNCFRENKNKYFLSYIEYLIRRGIFDVVEVGFLPVGHTHSDVDKAFSTTADRLRYHDAVTLNNMEILLGNCYNEFTRVISLQEVANWSGLCNQESCCNVIKNITMYRYFRFKGNISSSDGTVHPICQVRSTVDENWFDIITNNGPRFLRFLPDLMKTPPETLRSPDDYSMVSAKINSEEGRILSEGDLQSLNELRESVYKNEKNSFHWDLNSVIECKNIRSISESDEDDLLTNQSSSGTKYEYLCGCFVAVKAGDSEHAFPFWVAKVLDTVKGTGMTADQSIGLSVMWFSFYGSSNVYTSRYRPWIVNKKPWTSTIYTSSVYAKFDSLTKDKRLPSSLSTHLRSIICL